MRAIISEVPPDILQQRARTGADQWDEMWEGVLHMAPVPNRTHQELGAEIHIWLYSHWAKPLGNKVYLPINVASVGGWPNDYRIPDLVLLTPDRFDIDHNEYFEGPPTVVVEIRSPGDETIEKLPFYARLGVPEVWIIDRDTKVPELHVLTGSDYQEQPPAGDGWVQSPATGIRLRAEASEKLAMQLADDQNTRRLLPEE